MKRKSLKLYRENKEILFYYQGNPNTLSKINLKKEINNLQNLLNNIYFFYKI